MKPPVRIAILEKHGGLLTWHHDLAAGFRACGAVVFPINLRVSNWSEFVEKRCHPSTSIHNIKIQARIATELAACQPNLVVVLNRAGLPAAAAELWRSALPAATPIVGWLCDHMGTLPPDEIPAFDGLYYFDSASHPYMAAIYAKTRARLAHLPLAVNQTRFPLRSSPATQRRPRFVFAGNCTPDRLATIARLRAMGTPIDVYGPHSGEWRYPWRNRSYSADSLSRLYAKHLACLNLLQAANTRNGLNLRVFEIACSGGIGTYPDVPDLITCFEPDREILTYRTLDELPTIMTRLQRDLAWADTVIKAGRKRVLAKHTYDKRAAQMISDFAL